MANKKFTKKAVAKNPLACVLFDLGYTPDQIARNLEKKKIKGDPGESESCALAVYYGNKFGGEAGVKGTEITVAGVDGLSLTTDRAPAAYVRFQINFDDWKYPKLVTREAWIQHEKDND